MPSLTDIPGYGGYVQRRAMNEAAPMQELQQASALQGIVAKSQAMQEEQQLKGVLAQSGGDPAKAVEVLTKAGTPRALELAAKIKGLAPKPAEPYTLGPDQTRFDAQGNPVAFGVPRPDQAPPMRTRYDGTNAVQEELQPDGSWKKVGSGPRFQAQEPMVPVKGADGRVTYTPRSQSAGLEVGGRQTDMNLGKTVQQLGRDLEKANLPSTIPVIENAAKITPELAGWLTGEKALLPDRVVPAEVVKARQDLAKLFNITLKDRSGAAVTNQELERLKEEFGKGLLRTPKSLIDAISTARSIVEKHYQNIAATHGPEALKAYNENLEAIGGTPFQPRGTVAKAIYATNGTQRLMSTDGGATWRPAPAK